MWKILMVGIGLSLLSGPSLAAEVPDLEDEKQKLSYSIGYQVGGDFRRQGLEIEPELVVKGVLDALAGSEPLMTPEEMRQALTELTQQLAATAKQQREEQAGKNLAEGQAFLAENAKKEGVKTLPSGLQYQVLNEGEGDPPAATDTVTVHYRGTLIDGNEFDSSYVRGEPATFPLDRVIPGWTEGLQLMRPGAKYRLFVPPELAYGSSRSSSSPSSSPNNAGRVPAAGVYAVGGLYLAATSSWMVGGGLISSRCTRSTASSEQVGVQTPHPMQRA
jgi:FKBP-type peptidyl-prolyl cis-trans isomerase FklB